jgi:hypothetical protein
VWCGAAPACCHERLPPLTLLPTLPDPTPPSPDSTPPHGPTLIPPHPTAPQITDRVFSEFSRRVGVASVREYEESALADARARRERMADLDTQVGGRGGRGRGRGLGMGPNLEFWGSVPVHHPSAHRAGPTQPAVNPPPFPQTRLNLWPPNHPLSPTPTPQISRLEAQAEYERSRDRAAALADKEKEAAKDRERLEKIKVGGGRQGRRGRGLAGRAARAFKGCRAEHDRGSRRSGCRHARSRYPLTDLHSPRPFLCPRRTRPS